MKHITVSICCTLAIALSAACTRTTPPLERVKEDVRSAAFYCTHVQWCNFVAVEKNWPIVNDRQETTPITHGSFRLQLQKNIDKLQVISTPPTLIATYADYRLAISLRTVNDFGLLALANEETTAPSDGKYRALDFFEILFTKTLADPEPEHHFDRRLWRAAFVKKSSSMYSLISEAEIYRHGPWTVYMANLNGVGHERDSIIIHRDKPDTYLRVHDLRAPKTTILNLIATVDLNR